MQKEPNLVRKKTFKEATYRLGYGWDCALTVACPCFLKDRFEFQTLELQGSHVIDITKRFFSNSILLCLALQKLVTQINDLLQSGAKFYNQSRKIPKRCLKRNTK